MPQDPIDRDVSAPPAPPAHQLPEVAGELPPKKRLYDFYVKFDNSPKWLNSDQEWRIIRRWACVLSGHPKFDKDTMDWLMDWLLADCGKTDALATETAEVIELLRAAVQRRTGANVAGTPRHRGGAGQDEGIEPPGKRGRKLKGDPQKDQEIVDGWERAKGAGISKKDYAASLNLKVLPLNRILNRHAKRQKRARK
jgi:hypothetical protein